MTKPLEPVVLLVDDEEGLLRLLGDGLEQAGFRVVRSTSAAEAIARAQQLGRVDVLAVDLVLTDRRRHGSAHVQQPVMQGLELVQRIRTHQPDVTVVMFSGHPEGERAAQTQPGIAFLRKPFDARALADRIHEQLALKWPLMHAASVQMAHS